MGEVKNLVWGSFQSKEYLRSPCQQIAPRLLLLIFGPLVDHGSLSQQINFFSRLTSNESFFSGYTLWRIIRFYICIVLASYCCCNKLVQTNGLKHHIYIILQSQRSEVWNASYWTKIKVLAGSFFFWRF